MGQGSEGWARQAELAAAWALSALVLMLAAVSSAIDLRAGASPLGAFLGDTTMPIVGFALVGALIISQRPRHRLGWMLLAAPVFLAGGDVATRLAAAAQDQPTAIFAAWASRWLWSPGFVLLFVLIPICFPDGRLPSARWRPVLIGSSDLAVAGSTLAVAAAFRPARRRVQHLVDRRFNRARYDAERTVDAYRVRLREETHLDEVTAGLVGAVHDTVQPAAAGVWLRTDAGAHA